MRGVAPGSTPIRTNQVCCLHPGVHFPSKLLFAERIGPPSTDGNGRAHTWERWLQATIAAKSLIVALKELRSSLLDRVQESTVSLFRSYCWGPLILERRRHCSSFRKDISSLMSICFITSDSAAMTCGVRTATLPRLPRVSHESMLAQICRWLCTV